MAPDFTLRDLDARVEAAQAALAEAIRNPDSDSERFTAEAVWAHWQNERDGFLRRFYERHPEGDPYREVSG